ncbi:unnamed protein product [Adineta steineri]|uniref:Uncharacterized protein n=1 Tax=Adineta steineri TaxID=433720 RepID=A0A814URP0_9BILA|nr:unnamed protein product [Adineta steineri]CAF3852411.1 unnamed protein product [Adineta steineri]
MDDYMDVSLSTTNQSAVQISNTQASHDPLTWAVSDVTLWLQNCGLGQLVADFEVRTGAKAHCKWDRHESKINQLDLESMLHPRHTIHILPVSNVLNNEALDLLSKLFNILCVASTTNTLDPDFNIIIDEPLNIQILLDAVFHSRSLKPYIFDSLKRYHSLSDVMQILSSDIDTSAVNNDKNPFCDIVEKITQYILLVCTIESMSFESQQFFGNIIRKNGLPIPLAYYTREQDEFLFKINFNTLAETFCYSTERILLCLGSPMAVEFGKTSILPCLFDNIKSESLNREGNAQLRFGCIDTIFASLNNKSYVVFDVHGTITTMNEDLITAIQEYCALQILFVTIADLESGDFIQKIMNYSTETRNKPTIIVIIDPEYGEKTAPSIIEKFQQTFSDNKWLHVSWCHTSRLRDVSSDSRLNDGKRIKRLRQALLNAFHSLEGLIDRQPICKSILAIEAYLLAIKSGSNISPPPLVNLEIENTLKSLFGRLSDKTNNLELVTPISYLESKRLKCEKELTERWDESHSDLQAQLEQIQTKLHDIDGIPQYSAFFIDLLTKRTYIELLITEKYLEQWRALYEPDLYIESTKAKHDAMLLLSRMKFHEEQYDQYLKNGKQAEAENSANIVLAIRDEYKTSQDRKIASNWDAIDKLGPNLLACKTLYELSMMNEVRDIAHDIIKENITAINNEGRQHIDRILANITHENFADSREDILINEFSSAIQATHKKFLEKCIVDYQSKTERSCFPLEIKRKVEKIIEPSILNMQGLLKEDFDEGLHKSYRDARISSAQRCLFDTIQQEFDRNTKLSATQLQAGVDDVYNQQLQLYTQTLRQNAEPEDQIILKILKFYNSTLQSNAANASKQSIYNLLHPLEITQFVKMRQQLNQLWQCLAQYEQSRQTDFSFWKYFTKVVTDKLRGDQNNTLLNNLCKKLKHWFENARDWDKNKKVLLKIMENLIPQLRDEIFTLTNNDHSPSSSSNPRVITHIFTCIDNLWNHEIIRTNRSRLSVHVFLSDVAVIALETSIFGSMKSEQRRYEKDLEKCSKDMVEWKERITVQVQHMHDSYEQGCDMANIISEEIFKEIGRILLDKALHEITEDIAKNQFINHEAVQNQAGFKTILKNINNIPDQVTNLTQTVKMKARIGCKERISRRLGCQSRCPGCGSKCSRPEPHDEELFVPWHECQCDPGDCTCEKPKTTLLKTHGTSHHIAQAFYGKKYYKVHTPVLELCYQRWKTGAMFVGDNEIAPLENFYSQYHPKWCDNLRHLSTNGKACDDNIPPIEQRRAWMIVRHALIHHYARRGIVEEDHYDKKFYPTNINALPADFELQWNTVDDILHDDDDDNTIN